MTIDAHLTLAVEHLVAALESPDSMRVLERNALNLAIGHIAGVQNARTGKQAKTDPPARVDGDPKF